MPSVLLGSTQKTTRTDSIVADLAGEDARARLHDTDVLGGSTLSLSVAGRDSRLRVGVEDEVLSRNTILADHVTLTADGSDAEARVEDNDFSSLTIAIHASGEARVRRNDFGSAAVSVAGDEDCRAEDNTPSVSCD